MNQLPKIRTKQDVTNEAVDKLNNGTDREKALVWLSAFTGSGYKGLPESDDHAKIERDALDDFRRNDFSGAREAVESLSVLVEHYKDLAERYLETLSNSAVSVDEYGSATNSPFTLLEGGEQVLGYAEALHVEDHDLDDLWSDYVKPYLEYAGESEKKWIAERFAKQIEEDM